MRISELSQATGVSVPTIKYYLREGLLQEGRRTAPTRATYDEGHVHRLRLIRALREVGGLDVAAIRAVVTAIDGSDLSRHEVFGVVQHALGPGTDGGSATPAGDEARIEVDRFLADLGWQVSADAPGRDALAQALVALRRLGREGGADTFRPYAQAADAMAAWEVPSIPTDEPVGQSAERLVVGTVIYEAAFAALRRLAHEHRSALLARGSGPSAGP